MNDRETAKTISVKASDVLEQIFGLEGKLPDEDSLCAMLRERKFAPLRVQVTEQADFLADDMDSFLKFVRVNSIKSVLYSFCYYSEKEIDQEFSPHRAPEEGNELGPGHGLLRSEGGGGGALGDAVEHGPVDGNMGVVGH